MSTTDKNLVERPLFITLDVVVIIIGGQSVTLFYRFLKLKPRRNL